MDRFHEMAVFISVAEEGSFSAAAKRMNLSAPAVTRAIAGLEERLGIQMLCRTTRYLRLTTAGQQYLDDARPILEELEVADETILGAPESPNGEVSIAVPRCIARHFIAPIVAKYLRRYHNTQVTVISVDQPSDLDNNDFDMSIRFGNLSEDTPHVVVGETRDVYCATPTYLKAYGVPNTPADLARHMLIDNPMREPIRRWAFQQDGQKVHMEVTPRMALSNLDACLAAVSCDFGIAQLASYQVDEGLKTGAYELILEDFKAPSYPINVVHQPAHAQTARAKAFCEFLIDHLMALPQLQRKDPDLRNQCGLSSCVSLPAVKSPMVKPKSPVPTRLEEANTTTELIRQLTHSATVESNKGIRASYTP